MFRDVKTRFSNRVDNYVKYRPGYPPEMLDFFSSIGMSEDSIVADIGSGTGILSQLLANNVHTVYGVEPNDEMRKAAERELTGYDNFISINGSAETSTLDSDSVDFVTVAQAFHWFDREKSLKEFRRILKDSGYLLLIWNIRLQNTSFLEGYEQLLLKSGTDYKEVNRHKIDNTEIESFCTGNYRKQIFDNQQEFNLNELKGRVFSSSYTPTPQERNYDFFNRGLEELFEQTNINGKVSFNYRTDVYSGNIK